MAIWDTHLNPLKEKLADFYQQEDDYRAFVREVGLEEKAITFTRNATTDWSNILLEAQKVGMSMVLAIIEKACKKYPDNTVFQDAENYVKGLVERSIGDSRVKILPGGLSMPLVEVFECHAQA